MRRFSSDIAVMEELTQTVFIKAYMSLEKYRSEAPFAHWLRSIASRTGYDHWRAEYRSGGTVQFEEHRHGAVAAPEIRMDASNAMDAAAVLERVMPKLRPDERQTLYMLYIDGMSVAEVAACMGWNASMTKMRSFRARRKLRKILQAEGIGPECLEPGSGKGGEAHG